MRSQNIEKTIIETSAMTALRFLFVKERKNMNFISIDFLLRISLMRKEEGRLI